MPYPMPDADCVHPIVLPNGQAHPSTVFLRNVVDHPKFEVGEFTYASDYDPPSHDGWANRLAPYLFPMSQETLKIGRLLPDRPWGPFHHLQRQSRYEWPDLLSFSRV